MIKKLFLLSFLFFGISIAGQAQRYKTAAGVRLESERFGLTLQQKIQEQATIEGIITIGSDEYSGTALYEWHRPMLGKRFNYYIGGGGHVGNVKNKGAFAGVDGIVGIEYKINGLPFLLSADVKPAVHFNHPDDWIGLSSGISVRYVLVKDKKPDIRWWQFRKQQQEKQRQKEKAQNKRGLRDIFNKQDK